MKAMERLNTSKTYSRILRFVDFDIPKGISVIMNGGLINEISFAEAQRILDMSKYRKGHVKKVCKNTFIIDRWIYNAIKNEGIL